MREALAEAVRSGALWLLHKRCLLRLPHGGCHAAADCRHPPARLAAGNAALAQAMCGAVVDVAAMVVALPPQGPAGGAALPPHPAAAVQEQGEQEQQLLLPFPAALRHNDCHYVYQVGLLGGKNTAALRAGMHLRC